MRHSDLAKTLEVNPRTLLRHRKALENRYGLELGTQNAREYHYYPEYVELLKASVKGLTLPETITAKTSFETEDPQVFEDVELLDEELPSEPKYQVETYALALSEPAEAQTLTVRRTDTSKAKKQTIALFGSAFNALDDLLSTIEEAGADRGQEAAAIYLNRYSASFQKEVIDGVQKINRQANQR